MAEEMLFTVAGSVAMPAQMISLEEAGLEERADLQEWVLSNPAILGPAVKVITFEIDGLPTAAGANRDRIHVLGLGPDGRLVVAELKSGRTPDTEVMAIVRRHVQPHPPRVTRRPVPPLQSRRQIPMTADEALADLQAHAPDLSRSAARPRVVLLARDFSPVVTASVVWLSEMGLDISLVQISAFRSYVYGQSGSSNVPMIAVNQIYPLREVEEFTISPERQRAKEMAEAKRRVQDASTVRRLVTAELVADGTIFTLSPPTDLGTDMRTQLEEWLNEDPARRTVYWQNNLRRLWSGTPTRWPTHPPHWSASSWSRRRASPRTTSAPSGGATPAGWTLVELAGPISGGRGALYREYWSRWLEGSASTTPNGRDVHAARTELHHPAFPDQGNALRAEFRGGGRIRSDFYSTSGRPRRARRSSRRSSRTGHDRVALRRPALVGAAARPRCLPDRRLQRGGDHQARGLRLLHRLDDRRPRAPAPGPRRRRPRTEPPPANGFERR